MAGPIADAPLFILAVITAAVLLFFMVYFVIKFADMEDYEINPLTLCNSLNKLVLPEYGIHGVLTFLFLISGQWSCVFLNSFLVAYNVFTLMKLK